MCDTYNCDYLPYTLFHLYLIDFLLNTDFPSNCCIFNHSITQKSVSQENAFKKSKNQSAFVRKTIGSNIFFYSNWKQVQVFKIAKFELNVTIEYGLRAKCTQLWPLKDLRLELHTCIQTKSEYP